MAGWAADIHCHAARVVDPAEIRAERLDTEVETALAEDSVDCTAAVTEGSRAVAEMLAEVLG